MLFSVCQYVGGFVLFISVCLMLQVFPKVSRLAHDISAAILELEESGELQQMEEEMWGFSDCERKLLENAMIQTVGASPFHGLFLLSGGASVMALLLTLIRLRYRDWEGRLQRKLMGRELWSCSTHMPRR